MLFDNNRGNIPSSHFHERNSSIIIYLFECFFFGTRDVKTKDVVCIHANSNQCNGMQDACLITIDMPSMLLW